MNRPILSLLSVLAFPSWLGAQVIVGKDTLPDTLSLSPVTASDSSTLTLLRARLPDLDTLRFDRYARINASWVPVPTSSTWPDSTETSLVIYRVGKRRYPVAVLLAPVSQSGDWDLEDTYYFDEEGRTYLIDHFFGSFAATCDVQVVHETDRLWLEPGVESWRRSIDSRKAATERLSTQPSAARTELSRTQSSRMLAVYWAPSALTASSDASG